jgi:hypothetical protein
MGNSSRLPRTIPLKGERKTGELRLLFSIRLGSRPEMFSVLPAADGRGMMKRSRRLK